MIVLPISEAQKQLRECGIERDAIRAGMILDGLYSYLPRQLVDNVRDTVLGPMVRSEFWEKTEVTKAKKALGGK